MALCLSLRNNASFVFDLYGFEFDRYYQRTYGLAPFDIGHVEFARCPYRFTTARVLRYSSKKLPIVQSLSKPWFLVENSSEFREDLSTVTITRQTYLMGYWQDERYFSSVKEKLKTTLSPRGALSLANAELSQRIHGTNSVAIHCRRLHTVGAAANAASASDAERRCLALGTDYYQKSIEYLSERLNNPHFFVFSDAPEWARQNLHTRFPIAILDQGRGPDYEDIFLMSHCRHHVVANSSFSWWGAWLASDEDHIVIAPKDIQYIPNIPERWMQL